MHETRHEIIRIRDPPDPQKVWFYLGKTHIFKSLHGPLKVLKMNPKWTPKEYKMAPESLQGTPKGAPKGP